MSAIRYGHSLWLAQVPKRARPSYPRHIRHREAEVCVVGGGMVGCTTAYVLAAAGVDVALVEAGRIGQQGTAATLGLLRQEPGADYRAVEATYGRRAARQIWQLTRRAMLDGAATLRRLKVRCGLDSGDAIYVTRDHGDVGSLRRELAARRTAGLDATWLGGDRLRRETNIEGAAAVRTRGNYQLDPYRACLGMARSAARRGAALFERSPVTRIRSDAKGVTVTTGGATIQAERVVVATGQAAPLFKPLVRHLRTTHTYAVATPPLGAKIRAELGKRATMIWDTEEPPHWLRWTRDHRIVFGGGDQSPVRAQQRDQTIVQRTGQLMYELSTLYPVISGIQPEYAWDRVAAAGVDRMPIIGRHRSYPRHQFAFGYGADALTTAFLAARALLRAHQGTPDRADDRLGFAR